MPFMKKLSEIGESIRGTLSTHKETVEQLESRVATLTHHVTEARQAQERAEQALEAAFEQQGDIHAAFRAVKDAEDHVRLAEAARAAGCRTLDEAQGNMDAAHTELRREELLADVTKLRDAAKEVDTAVSKLAVATEKWRKHANRIREHGNFELGTKLNAAVQLFRVRVLDGCGMAECRTGFGPYVGSKPWLEDQPTPEDVERVTSKKPKRVA